MPGFVDQSLKFLFLPLRTWGEGEKPDYGSLGQEAGVGDIFELCVGKHWDSSPNPHASEDDPVRLGYADFATVIPVFAAITLVLVLPMMATAGFATLADKLLEEPSVLRVVAAVFCGLLAVVCGVAAIPAVIGMLANTLAHTLFRFAIGALMTPFVGVAYLIDKACADEPETDNQVREAMDNQAQEALDNRLQGQPAPTPQLTDHTVTDDDNKTLYLRALEEQRQQETAQQNQNGTNDNDSDGDDDHTASSNMAQPVLRMAPGVQQNGSSFHIAEGTSSFGDASLRVWRYVGQYNRDFWAGVPMEQIVVETPKKLENNNLAQALELVKQALDTSCQGGAPVVFALRLKCLCSHRALKAVVNFCKENQISFLIGNHLDVRHIAATQAVPGVKLSSLGSDVGSVFRFTAAGNSSNQPAVENRAAAAARAARPQ